MDSYLIPALAAGGALTALQAVLVQLQATKRPRLAAALKGTTLFTLIVTIAATVVLAPDYYRQHPALAAYLAAPIVCGILHGLYRAEAMSPGRITGLITGIATGKKTRRTTTRKPRYVPSYLTGLRAWTSLALFEDTIPWRITHIATLAGGVAAAITLPSPEQWVAPYLLALVSGIRYRSVQKQRAGVIQRIYAIASQHLDYTKAVSSRLVEGGQRFASPASAIQVKWTDLVHPAEITIHFPITFAKTDLQKRNTFADEFDATLQGPGWRYDWDTSNATVTITHAAYPTNVRWEGRTLPDWSHFYLGDQLEDGSPVTFNVASESPHVLVAGETGSGKSSTLACYVPTPAGAKRLGDIHPGDYVLDPEGRPVKVVFETEPMLLDAYEVVFSDGAVVTVSGDHLWYTETRDLRKARSKQKGDYRGVQRRPRLDPDVVARLRADAAKAQPGDVITALDAAMLAGVHETTPWYRDLLAELPVVATVQEERAFSYAAQTVVQEQAVNRYQAAAASHAVSRMRGLSPEVREQAVALMETPPREEMTPRELSDALGLPLKKIRKRMWDAKVPFEEVREQVALEVPAKVVSRKGRTARAYPKVALLEALATAGEVYAHDQRHRMNVGAVRTTEQIMATLHAADGQVNHSVPVAKPLQLPDADLPIAPYTLGVWLGDGRSSNAEFCGIDHQVARNVEADGYAVRERTPTPPPGRTVHENFRLWYVPEIQSHLRSMKLLGTKTRTLGPTKHIPPVYLRASESQRRALLAGLLDTDGTVAPQGTVQFSNSNERLARGVWELALTLGYRATIREHRSMLDGVDYGPCWTVSFTTRDRVFRLDRKNQALVERTAGLNPEKTAHRYIVDVRPTGRREWMKCIQVDSPEHLYLIGEHFIPTHNTEAMFTVAAQALAKGWKVAVCDPKETGWAMWSRRRRATNLHGHDTGAEVLREGDGRPGVIEHAVELFGIRDVLSRMVAEMTRRKKVNGAHKVVKWSELPEDVREAEDVVPLMVVIDEALSLFDMEKGGTDEIKERNEVRGEALGLMQKLVVEARALGIHVLLGIQRPDAAVLGGAMRSNIGARVACGVMEPTGYQMMFQTQGDVPRLPVNGADGKKVIGRALVRSAPGQPIVPMQVAWLGDGQKDLETVAPMPADPEVEDNTPAGPFNPFLTDDPTPWLSGSFGEETDGQVKEEMGGGFGPDFDFDDEEPAPWEQAPPPGASGEVAGGGVADDVFDEEEPAPWLTPTPAWDFAADDEGQEAPEGRPREREEPAEAAELDTEDDVDETEDPVVSEAQGMPPAGEDEVDGDEALEASPTLSAPPVAADVDTDPAEEVSSEPVESHDERLDNDDDTGDDEWWEPVSLTV